MPFCLNIWGLNSNGLPVTNLLSHIINPFWFSRFSWLIILRHHHTAQICFHQSIQVKSISLGQLGCMKQILVFSFRLNGKKVILHVYVYIYYVLYIYHLHIYIYTYILCISICICLFSLWLSIKWLVIHLHFITSYLWPGLSQWMCYHCMVL